MEWTLMEPDSSGASGLGCFVEDIYVPADDCEDVLDEIIETLTREDPKLRNGRRKLSFDKIVEKDLVPLIMCCAVEGIIARALRLLANLTQPLEVFVQLGIPLGPQCQREINTLVNRAKACCTSLDFFKNLHDRMEMALLRMGREKVHPDDSELLNHALLLLRNLLHTSPDDQTSETSITLQSMLSSFFLSEMDKLVLIMLNHPQEADWVVSNVQLLSLVFKNYAGTLLEEDGEEGKDDSDCKSDIESLSDVFEFIPSQMSKLLSHNFDKQLQIGEVPMTVGELATSRNDEEIGEVPMTVGELATSRNDEETGDLLQGHNVMDSAEEPDDAGERVEKNMLMDGETEQDDYVGNGAKSDSCKVSPVGSLLNMEEEMSVSNVCVKNLGRNSVPEQGVNERDMNARELPEKQKQDEAHTKTEKQANQSSVDSDSGRPESSEEEKQGVRAASEREGREGDSGVEDQLPKLWENVHMEVFKEKEREIMSELSSGSCLMDGDIIVAYLRKFATDIVCSGLNNLVQSLMKVLLRSCEGVLDDSFFMWTVGFFLSFARHTHIEFSQYKDLLNLDVFGFLAYQGYRNCEILAGQLRKQEICLLIKYRLHLVVCTLNQLFQVILTRSRETGEDGDHIHTLQKCLAQMGDLRRLFILLLRSHQAPYDMVYLRDLIHTNHTYLLLLEEWVSRGYVPSTFSMLSHIKQYADVDVMQKYGHMLEQYAINSELLNVAIMTMMYHIAGDCNHGDVLLQLPILKTFSEIWDDFICRKYVEFNDLIEFILETFMSMAITDPVKCAQKLFNMTSNEDVNSENGVGVGSLTEEEQDLLFMWTTDLQGSVNMVDDLVKRLHSRGSSATRQQVMLHLLHNGWLEEKQKEALSEEIKELQETSDKAKKTSIVAELSGLDQEQLLPFLLEKLRGAGYEGYLRWLQDQLLEAAYVRLGVRDKMYRVHVEEPLARFYALQDKSIPLVSVNAEEEQVVRDPYFTALLQVLGLFPADAIPSCVFCRIPQFLTPAQLLSKAQQLGDIDLSSMKFDLTKVQDELSYTEFSPMFKDSHCAEEQGKEQTMDIRLPTKNQSHQWLNFVCHFNQSKESQCQSQSQA